jgi:selenocysteine lyase/cysteine desulfurase
VPLTRRDLVARAGLAAGGLALAGSGSARSDPRSEATLDPRSWASVRQQFALRAGVTNLSAFVLAAHPAPVRRAIERHRKGLDADPYGYLHRNQATLENSARAAAAAHLGADASELALTDSTTMGLGLLYGGIPLGPGDEVLTTEHDFYSTHEALWLSARRTGATVRRTPLYRNLATVSTDELVDTLVRALRPSTRVVALTWVHSSTGLKLPIRAIAEALRGRALLVVDAVHALGVESADVRSLGCDFLVAGCHKWLGGPRGTGIVWGRSDRWADVRPTIPSFDDGGPYASWLDGSPPSTPTRAATMTPGGYHSFEHRWALREAFAFHRAIGKTRVETRIHTLATKLKTELERIRGVRVVTPASPQLSAGIVCVEVDGQAPQRVVERLLSDHRVVASVTPYATPYVRFGPGLYSSEADVRRAAKALAAIA